MLACAFNLPQHIPAMRDSGNAIRRAIPSQKRQLLSIEHRHPGLGSAHSAHFSEKMGYSIGALRCNHALPSEKGGAISQSLPMVLHAESCLLCKVRQPGWFCDLPPLALAEYDAMSVHVMAPIGTTLFAERQPSLGVSIVCFGQVKLTKSSPNGKTLLVRVAKSGDVLGLSAALSKTPYEVTAETLEYCQIKTFRREDFLQFLKHHVEGSLHAAESLNKDYRAALIDACRLALSSSIAGRMAHLLIQLASESGTWQDAEPSIHMSLKHEDLSSMLACSRETVSRVLSDLKHKGIIAVTGTRTTVLRKYALESLT